MIVAIDGPAASGKGTIARRLAAHYDLPHLDTGLLYRATCLLYTSDAADERSSVDLGGRRIINKKTKEKKKKKKLPAAHAGLQYGGSDRARDHTSREQQNTLDTHRKADNDGDPRHNVES